MQALHSLQFKHENTVDEQVDLQRIGDLVEALAVDRLQQPRPEGTSARCIPDLERRY